MDPVAVGDEVDADLLNNLQNRTNKTLCVVRKSTITSVANGGAVLTWDTEDADSHNIHSTVTNTSRITPNIEGWYRITATVHWSNSSASGRRGIAIYTNGGTARYGQIIPGSTAGTISTTVTRTLYANGSTDYFEVFAYQDSGGAYNTADTVGTVFEVSYDRDDI